MACSYYDFRNNDYYCIKKSDYVNSDCYYRYCRDYNYANCPIYKNETSSGCYISTACFYALDCHDDCEELNTLRNFRDTFLRQQINGERDIKEYYQYAPEIVSKINRSKEYESTYRSIFFRYIKPCLDFIYEKQFAEAYNLYKEMFHELKEKYQD